MPNLEGSFSRSYAYGPSAYRNTGSGTLTLNTGDCDPDAEGRIAWNGGSQWLEETQASPTNNLMDPDVAPLGSAGRWYLQVRGTGSLAFYRNGVQATTPVAFDSGDLWILVDSGETVVRGFDETLSLRVWGDDPIHCGGLFHLHRPLIYNAVDVLVGSPPNTTVVSDAGSIAANVAEYYQVDRSDPPEQIIEITPGLDPTEDLVPLMVARIAGGTIAGGCNDIDGHAEYEDSTSKNGSQFGTTNPAATSFSGSVYRITPVVSQVNMGITTYPPGNTSGETSFDSDDVLGFYAARMTTADGNPEPQVALYDQIVLVRDCACAFFDAYNEAAASSFEYSWSDGGCSPAVDHYVIVVTNQDGDANLGDGTVLQTIDPATSPTTVSGLSGPVRVYLLAVTADGDFACFDYDEETVAVAAVNMAAWIGR